MYENNKSEKIMKILNVKVVVFRWQDERTLAILLALLTRPAQYSGV